MFGNVNSKTYFKVIILGITFHSRLNPTRCYMEMHKWLIYTHITFVKYTQINKKYRDTRTQTHWVLGDDTFHHVALLKIIRFVYNGQKKKNKHQLPLNEASIQLLAGNVLQDTTKVKLPPTITPTDAQSTRTTSANNNNMIKSVFLGVIRTTYKLSLYQVLCKTLWSGDAASRHFTAGYPGSFLRSPLPAGFLEDCTDCDSRAGWWPHHGGRSEPPHPSAYCPTCNTSHLYNRIHCLGNWLKIKHDHASHRMVLKRVTQSTT